MVSEILSNCGYMIKESYISDTHGTEYYNYIKDDINVLVHRYANISSIDIEYNNQTFNFFLYDNFISEKFENFKTTLKSIERDVNIENLM